MSVRIWLVSAMIKGHLIFNYAIDGMLIFELGITEITLDINCDVNCNLSARKSFDRDF